MNNSQTFNRTLHAPLLVWIWDAKIFALPSDLEKAAKYWRVSISDLTPGSVRDYLNDIRE